MKQITKVILHQEKIHLIVVMVVIIVNLVIMVGLAAIGKKTADQIILITNQENNQLLQEITKETNQLINHVLTKEVNQLINQHQEITMVQGIHRLEVTQHQAAVDSEVVTAVVEEVLVEEEEVVAEVITDKK